MKIEQIYTACLAQGAYYIESEGEAAIIDPLREVDQYIQMANSRGTNIKYIFETHFHADFVSGHVDLAKKTGAKIVYGPTKLKTGFDAIIAEDNQIFALGKIKIQLIHTPGHTMESSCYLLFNEQDEPQALFTGDTLFIGDVGRPDLAQHVIAELTEEILAEKLYDSLRNKILPLPDHIIIYPAHGAGSACGKNLSNEKMDTLGNQKRSNYALREGLTKEQFKKELLEGLTRPPYYFPKNVLMNVSGYDSIDVVMDRGTKKIPVTEFNILAKNNEILVLDTRLPEEFAKAHIPGSIFIGVVGNFAVWAGTVIKDINQKIIIIANQGKEQEVVTRLARVGYDNAIGYLDGGFETWQKAGLPVESFESITAVELESLFNKDHAIQIIDVRKKSEYDSEHLNTALNYPLDYYEESLTKLEKQNNCYVHCAGGYRSMVFLSLLRKQGFNNLVDVKGGFKAIKETTKIPITDYVAPTTML